MKTILNKKYYLFGIISIIIFWFVLAYIFKDNSFVIPSPIKTIDYLLYLLSKEYTYRCIYNSFKLMFIGFIIAFSFAIVCGIFSGNSKKIEDFISPFLLMVRSIPTISIVFIFIIISGYENAPILLVSVISFPILYQGVLFGIKNINIDYIESMRIDGASIIEENVYLRLPLSIPSIISSIMASFSLSFKVEIMAEVICGNYVKGLGSAINGARIMDPTNMVPIFAYSLIAIMIMLIIDLFANLLNNK